MPVSPRVEAAHALIANCAAPITFNVKDFARITTEWTAAGRSHAGCMLIVGIDPAEFGLILRVLEHGLSVRPDQADWIDYTAWGVGGTTT